MQPPPESVPLPALSPIAGPDTRPRFTSEPQLVIKARADYRLALAAVLAAVGLDAAIHVGFSSLAGSSWVVVIAAGLLLGNRIQGWLSVTLISAAALLGLTFTVRASPWVITPVGLAIAVLLPLGASVGADRGGLATTFPGLTARLGIVAAHVINAPGMFYFKGESAPEVRARRWSMAVLRGALFGVPIMLIVGVLLASADPIFRSWFDPSLVFQHVVYLVIGGWVMVGLARAASAERPAARLRTAPKFGSIEAAVVLGGLCAVYTAFVVAQFVALSGAGHRILVTHGLTYAEYARSGFFRLLICAAITLIVLLGVRVGANPANPVLNSLSALTTLLTIGVVVVAFRRLELYEAVFGLTMLRLACFFVAVWIAVVFVLLGLTFPARGLPRRYFPAAFIVSAVLLIGTWVVVNPASVVARTDLSRAEHGRALDYNQELSLGPDATPVIVSQLAHLPHPALMRGLICLSLSKKRPLNVSERLAQRALDNVCLATGSRGQG